MVLRGQEPEGAERRLQAAIDDGSALEAWRRMVTAHGGDPDPERLARPRRTRDVVAPAGGWLIGVAADALGHAAVDLGAGRRSRDEPLAHGAGLEVHVRIGERIGPGQPLVTMQVGDREVDEDAIVERLLSAFEIGDEPVEPPSLILGTVDDVENEGESSA
jgi:thymidine phosphorylase